MGIDTVYPEFEVIRNASKCTNCRRCVTECASGVHSFDEKNGVMVSDDTKCVDCQRCVAFCPVRALKIVKSGCGIRENANWREDTVREIYKQAATGGVLLSSMGNPTDLPVYWDRIVVNASQVTNPSIDPLREPMETRVFLGKKPTEIRRDENGSLICDLPPRLPDRRRRVRGYPYRQGLRAPRADFRELQQARKRKQGGKIVCCRGGNVGVHLRQGFRLSLGF